MQEDVQIDALFSFKNRVHDGQMFNCARIQKLYPNCSQLYLTWTTLLAKDDPALELSHYGALPYTLKDEEELLVLALPQLQNCTEAGTAAPILQTATLLLK